MLQATPIITIPGDELTFDFIRAPGPGGQNVNKVNSAVQLRFDVKHTPSLPEPVRRRLMRLAGKRVTSEGVLVIRASRFRSQVQNRRDATERLLELVRSAAKPPRHRIRTRPSRAARQRRLDAKRYRGRLKQHRKAVTRERD
ncbi:Peptidyl-tRNA hydrolase ArfB (EC [Olavius algarvensis associated proteobacterium Delta 3]|nr:Peptidyl-tRNA hydrolase ArfB (EC [Olavius algarvensis associated proteobacterium Delta 3]CAB5170829.1 Peptidyl-tRNA hydrolase ArfB (EC [Olavius algarvensis associated proteobacterium Delta 3]